MRGGQALSEGDRHAYRPGGENEDDVGLDAGVERAEQPGSVAIRRTPVLFLRSSAREIPATLNPLFQRSSKADILLRLRGVCSVPSLTPIGRSLTL
jgi:hypothetical protein